MDKLPFYTRAFYSVKPLIPRPLQLALRRIRANHLKVCHADCWPIDPQAGKAPADWPGWPDGKPFAVVLTHDVESQKGHDRCLELAELEAGLGFRSSFNFVPEGRYSVSPGLRRELVSQGFEVGVHGLKHDGKLFSSFEVFQERAERINRYIEEWGAAGFRAPAMHRHADWIGMLNIRYDASTFDTDPFEPQPCGVGTVFPFRVAGDNGRPGYVELPYTLAQDFTLFVVMRERTVDIWKQKLEWIAQRGGMALVNVHPDYLHVGTATPHAEEYRVELYEQFLTHIRDHYAGQYWHGLPREVAQWVAGETQAV